jgi:PKD repeat protein
MSSTFNRLEAVLAAPGATNTDWNRAITLPTGGDYSVTAFAFDTAGQQDSSTTGATARYSYFPGDAPPGFEAGLGQPVDGSTFNQGKIVVTGRAIDDIGIARVDVAVVNSAGQYMSSTGAFTTTTPSWRAAFLNSPGSPGSNYSYTTPVMSAGTYTVHVRPTDNKDQVGALRTATGVVVTLPANNPPVAHATVSCNQNVCTFDGRGSTDENPAALTYSWAYGTTPATTGTGPVPVKTFTSPGTFTVTLTVKDEWGATGSSSVPVTIVEPAGNSAPTPTFTTNCTGLLCRTSSAGTTDPNTGDVISYSWNWGDDAAASAGATSSHTYAAAGTYTITLTATDGWGKSATTTRRVTVSNP